MNLQLVHGEMLIQAGSKVGKLTVRDLLAFAEMNHCELRIRFEKQKAKTKEESHP